PRFAAINAVSRSFVARQGIPLQIRPAAWRILARSFSVRAPAMPMATADGPGNSFLIDANKAFKFRSLISRRLAAPNFYWATISLLASARRTVVLVPPHSTPRKRGLAGASRLRLIARIIFRAAVAMQNKLGHRDKIGYGCRMTETEQML